MVINKSGSKNLNCIVAAFFVGIILFSRGSLLGNIALKVSLFCSIICIVLSIENNKIGKNRFCVYIVCLLFFVYCFAQGLMFNATGYRTVIENTVYWIFASTAALLSMTRKSTEKVIGKALIYILAAFTVSYFITALLSLVMPLQRLLLTTVNYGYFYNAPLYLPFTLVYGTGKIGNFELLRMQGFGRECGITQTFYIWAFYKCQDYFKNTKLFKLLMGLGVLVCFSTTGLVIFTVSFVVDYLLRHKKEKTKKKYYLLLLIAILFILVFGGTFSLAKRIEVSYADRIDNIIKGFETLSTHPVFGIGFMKSQQTTTSDLSDICFLASVGKVGLVGICLFLLIYFVALYNSTNRKKFLLCNSGFFLTTVLAQPLYYVPLIYIMLFVDYYSKETSCQNGAIQVFR